MKVNARTVKFTMSMILTAIDLVIIINKCIVKIKKNLIAEYLENECVVLLRGEMNEVETIKIR